ncbi:hypothetical protein DFH09DRAFT_1204450 [Mycena vulgaris]|nr:hypothetical protein DFH09DRAFT_1204450 [Mycena vulgaris]
MSTPPSAPASMPDATPQSKGSGSHHNYASEHTQKDYAPYLRLREDLIYERTITVAQFFQWILRITNAHDTSSTENDPKFQKYLAKYNRWDAYKHETELYQPFVELANYCIGKQAKIRFGRDDPTIALGSDAERKPVVSIWEAALALGARTSADNLSDGGPGRLNAFHWMELIAFREFKFVPGGIDPVTPTSSSSTQVASPPTVPPKKAAKKPPPPPSSRELRMRADIPAGPPTTRPSENRASSSAKARPEKEEDPWTQCASYALELLTYGGLRSHVIGALITNNFIEPLYYDHSIIGILRPRTGHRAPGGANSPFRWFDIKLNDGRLLTMGETIFQSHGIIGRGTCVSRAKMEVKGEVTDVIVKWSWPATSRTPEADFVKIATKLATASGDSWVLNHLPKILHAEQKEFDEDSPQRRLSKHFGEEYELRVLCTVVQEGLRPITELTTAAELSQAFRGIFKSGIMHRDISRNNLMYREIDGKVYGVLNDFDLSVFRDKEPRSTSKQRTGTEPYMAVDLLVTGPPPPHLYRFDLESLLLRKKIDNPPFDAWDHLGTEALQTIKERFLAKVIPKPTSNFLSFNNLNVALHRIFQTGYSAREYAEEENDPFDNTTLGGNVDFDKFEVVLETNLPSVA